MNAQTHSAESRLALLRSPSARVVVLIAPAGYGKTTAANALRAEYAYSAVYNCADAEDLRSFTHNLIRVLDSEHPGDGELFPHLQSQLLQAVSESDVLSILDAAWSKLPPNSLFIFDNAEAIATNTELSSALTRLLTNMPASTRVIVCSRTPLPVRASRYLPPHRMSTLTTKHFVLDDVEAADFLQREGVDREYWPRIISIARGWPIILLLLARLAVEGRLESALSDARGVSFEDLFDYFLREVLAPLDPTVKRMMMFCAAVPNLTASELREVLDMTPAQLDDTTRRALLVEREEQFFSIHPFVRNVLLQSDPQWRDLLAPVAQIAARHGDYLRAAHLYRLAQRLHSAGGCLAAMPFEDLQSSEAMHELAHLPEEVLRRHAKLVATADATLPTPVLREGFERLSDHDDPEAIAALAGAYSHRSNNLADGLAILDAPVVQRAARRSQVAAALIATVRVLLKGFFGAAASIESEITEMYGVARASGPSLRTQNMAHFIATIKRRKGDREGCLHWNALMIADAAQSRPSMRALLLLCALYDAWFWHDDKAFSAYYEQLERDEADTHDPQYVALLQALNPNTVEAGLPLASPAMNGKVLIMALSGSEGERRSWILSQLHNCIEDVPGTASAHDIHLAIAASEPALRTHHCSVLLQAIDAQEMPQFYQAVERFAAGNPSFLDIFVARFQPSLTAREQPDSAEAAYLQLLRGEITVGDRTINITGRESAFLTFLSRHKSATSREEIQDAIWPDLDEISARDALYSLVHRLRKRVGKFPIVEGTGNAYRLASNVRVDSWDAEILAQKVHNDAAGELVDQAVEVYACLRDRTNAHLSRYDWFSSIDFRTHENARTLGRYLIMQAEKRNDFKDVIRFANALIQEEPCDEWAHEAIIRAHLRTDQRFEAARAYRNYCTLLREQIGADPSEEMQERVRAAIG